MQHLFIPFIFIPQTHRALCQLMVPGYKPFNRNKLSEVMFPTYYEYLRPGSSVTQGNASMCNQWWLDIKNSAALMFTVTIMSFCWWPVPDESICPSYARSLTFIPDWIEHCWTPKEISEEFGITRKVVAITDDNAPNMDVAVRKLEWLKIPCFAHTLNLAANKVSLKTSCFGCVVCPNTKSSMIARRDGTLSLKWLVNNCQ
jgi:hypothetical protein